MGLRAENEKKNGVLSVSGRRRNLWMFDVDRWRSDEAVSLLRPAARDFWHEALMVMWKQGETGELKGSINDLQRLCRCSPAEARGAVDEIKARNVAEVRECNGVVTIICRSMQRQFLDRATVAFRVAKHRSVLSGKPLAFEDVTAYVTHLKRRCNADVTQAVSPLSPASFLPPITPLLSPPSDPSSNTSARARAADGSGGSGGKTADRAGGADALDLALRGLPPIPPVLDVPAFRTVWLEWIVHRRERGPKLTPRAAAMQLKHLATLAAAEGIERVIGDVEHSIANSYQGIFPAHRSEGRQKGNRDGHDSSSSNSQAARNRGAGSPAAVGGFERSSRELPDVATG